MLIIFLQQHHTECFIINALHDIGRYHGYARFHGVPLVLTFPARHVNNKKRSKISSNQTCSLNRDSFQLRIAREIKHGKKKQKKKTKKKNKKFPNSKAPTEPTVSTYFKEFIKAEPLLQMCSLKASALSVSCHAVSTLIPGKSLTKTQHFLMEFSKR